MLEGKVRDFWPVLLLEGIVFIGLGAAAVILPPFASLTITILLGWLIMVSGLADAIVTLSQPHRPGFWLSLLSDFLALLVGGILFGWSANGAIPIALALSTFLAIDGVIAIMIALAHRRQFVGKWKWLLVNGVLDILLAGFILAVFPRSELWALGWIVGADLLFAGATLMAMALDERGEVRDSAEEAA
jgi:uncharacterized membrane protein HdeD (DUF308 family)